MPKKEKKIHPQFQRMIDEIEAALSDVDDDKVYSGRVDFSNDPPSAMYHTTLDNKEYIIAVIPSDLASPGLITEMEEPEE